MLAVRYTTECDFARERPAIQPAVTVVTLCQGTLDAPFLSSCRPRRDRFLPYLFQFIIRQLSSAVVRMGVLYESIPLLAICECEQNIEWWK
jgi:hypothetical protein